MLGIGSRAWLFAAVTLALVALVVSGLEREVVFHLTPEDPERSARRFASEGADIEIDPATPWAMLPRFVPGTADDRSGSRAHSVTIVLHPRARRPTRLRLCAASKRPTRLVVLIE